MHAINILIFSFIYYTYLNRIYYFYIFHVVCELHYDNAVRNVWTWASASRSSLYFGCEYDMSSYSPSSVESGCVVGLDSSFVGGDFFASFDSVFTSLLRLVVFGHRPTPLVYRLLWCCMTWAVVRFNSLSVFRIGVRTGFECWKGGGVVTSLC